MPLISSASSGGPVAQNPLDLLRPGSPPPHVITVPEVCVLRLLGEDCPEQLLTNLPQRSKQIHDQTTIGCLATSNPLDLGRDRATVAPFLKDKPSMSTPLCTLRVTRLAQKLVDGAGMRIVDFRGQQPTSEELAEFLADPLIVGVYLSHPEAGRLAWILLLKPEPVRLLQERRLIQLDMRTARFARRQLLGPLGPLVWLRRGNQGLRAWTSELEITAGLLLRLATLISTAILIFRAIGLV